jgi:hypothetical protein
LWEACFAKATLGCNMSLSFLRLAALAAGFGFGFCFCGFLYGG